MRNARKESCIRCPTTTTTDVHTKHLLRCPLDEQQSSKESKIHLEQGPVVLDGFGDGHFYPIPEALRRLVRGSQLRNRFLIGEKKMSKCCGSEVILFGSGSGSDLASQ